MTPETDRMLNPERPAEQLEEKTARLEAEQRTAGTESPSALLLRAAAHLERLALALPQGSRRLEYRNRKGTNTVVQIDCYGPPQVRGGSESHRAYHGSRIAQAEYDLVTQPDVMLGVVRMLRAAATVVKGMPNAERWHIASSAISTARTILGEAS